MKVSISYAHTSVEHKEKVLLFANKLLENGININIDYYDLEIGNDLYFFMEKLTLSEENDYIIVICNKNYKDKADNYKGGVGFEARNLRYLSSDPKQTKVIPVIFEHDLNGNAIRPNFLLTCLYKDLTYDIDFSSSDFKELIDFLKGVRRLKPKVNPSPEWGFTQAYNEDQLSHFNNIEFTRKVNIVNRSKYAVSKIAAYYEENKFKDCSTIQPILLKSWSGEGKTTIAIEFAFQFGLQFIASFWIDSSKSIGDQFEKISQNCLNIQIENYKDEKELRQKRIDALREYINKHAVLIIFDNIDELSEIERFLPKTGKSRVIAITTNFNLKTETFFHEIELPKLTDSEALQILCQGFKIKNKETEIAINISKLLGNSPFALELANSFLLEYSDISLLVFYNDIRENTIKWEGLQKEKGFNFIHSSPSVISLIERRIIKLDETNDVDKLSKEVLSIIGCMEIAGDVFDYNTIKECINLKEDSKENLLMFNKIKNRLSGLGLVANSDNKFIVHTLTLEYLKNYTIYLNILQRIIDYKIDDLKKWIPLQIQMGIWIGCNDSIDSLEKLLLYYLNNFKPTHSNEINRLIMCFMFLHDQLYFNSLNERDLNCIEMALMLANSDGDFKYFDVRLNNITYQKALVLHKMEKYDDAMNIYQNLTTNRSPMSSGLDLINCLIYSGHIYRKDNRFEDAIDIYKRGLLNADKFLEGGYISEANSLIIKIRIYLFLDCCYKEAGLTNELSSNKIFLDEHINNLMKFAPDNVKEMDSHNIHRYPFEIGQQMINPNSLKPLDTMLQVITSEPVD